MLPVNSLAVLVAAIAAFVIGGLWYSPVLFAKPWMKAMGHTDASMKEMQKKGMSASYILNFIGALVMALVLAQLIARTGARDATGATMLASWIWLGFFAAPALNSVLWENRPWALWFINVGAFLVQLAVMALIIVSWT